MAIYVQPSSRLHNPNVSAERQEVNGSWNTTRAPNAAATSVMRHPGRNPHHQRPDDYASDVASVTH